MSDDDLIAIKTDRKVKILASSAYMLATTLAKARNGDYLVYRVGDVFDALERGEHALDARIRGYAVVDDRKADLRLRDQLGILVRWIEVERSNEPAPRK